MLQRPPPDTFTFDKSLCVFSKIEILQAGSFFARFIAAKKPAAPPPIITICFCVLMI